MPSYSKTSRDRLSTCHYDLQVLFNTVILTFDNSILCGHRDRIAQDAAFVSGRSKVLWPASDHNEEPSMAVDSAPYPISWSDTERFCYYAGYVKGIAAILHYEGLMQHKLGWGGDWDNDTQLKDNNFNDLAHFYLIRR